MALDSRKTFDDEDYKNNQACFDSLQKHFRYLYIHLLPENKEIDVAVYIDRAAYENKRPPLCYLELEAKQHWKDKQFPYDTVNFLAKKQKYATLDSPAYWILFNHDFSDAATIDLMKIPLNGELKTLKVDRDYDFEYIYTFPGALMIWGIQDVERFLIFEGFRARQHIHNFFK